MLHTTAEQLNDMHNLLTTVQVAANANMCSGEFRKRDQLTGPKRVVTVQLDGVYEKMCWVWKKNTTRTPNE